MTKLSRSFTLLTVGVFSFLACDPDAKLHSDNTSAKSHSGGSSGAAGAAGGSDETAGVAAGAAAGHAGAGTTSTGSAQAAGGTAGGTTPDNRGGSQGACVLWCGEDGPGTGGSGTGSQGRGKGGASSEGTSDAGASKVDGGGKGGAHATGGLGGSVNGSGGSASELCSWSGAPSSSNGELTCYWFGQGTSAGPECPGGYKTYCGYCGTEIGKKDPDSKDVCPVYDIVDKIQNISTEHFAAFYMSELDAKHYCGMCVEVMYQGYSILATIVDACPSCDGVYHLDLNLSAAEALGMTGWNGNPKSDVTWRAVACPTTSDIVATFNGTNTSYVSQVLFQNVAFPIASAEADGHKGTPNGAFWDFGAHVAGAAVTLTDVVGHKVTGTIPTKAGGSIGAQFELSCK